MKSKDTSLSVDTLSRVLFIPAIKKNNGTGHLKRTIGWVKSSMIEGPARFESFIYIPENIFFPGLKEIENSIVTDLPDTSESVSRSGKYDIAVFDMRETDPLLLKKVEKIAEILVSVDEGGKERGNFDYLIDTLPNTVSKSVPPNIFSTDLLGYKDKRNKIGCCAKSLSSKKYNNILISFGGEDSKGITKKLLDMISHDLPYMRNHTMSIEDMTKNFSHEPPKWRQKIIPRASLALTVIIGPFFKDKDKEYIKNNFGYLNIAESPASLENFIEESDIVITSFGLTAYEALYAGKDIILINPSKYHSKLSRLAGFCEAGIVEPDIKKIEKIICYPGNNRDNNPGYYLDKNFAARQAMLSPKQPQSAPGHSLPTQGQSNPAFSQSAAVPLTINELFLKIAETKSLKKECPVCGGKGKIYKRYTFKNYLKCEKCNILYLQNIGKKEIKYDKSYFFEEYKKQYGKTYIEDFSNISALSKKRVDIVNKFAKKGKALDIGCAYGPFLYAMKDQYSCYGIDISEDAVEYVKKELGIKAIAGDFSLPDFTFDFSGEKDSLKFDIITMWYVIEHFKNPKEVIEKVKKLINKSGIFAFSTPNLSGISGIYNKNKFLESSPSDHYTIWNISSAKHILSKFDFKVVKVRSTGHHPERFPLILQKILGFKILNLISKILKLGDTFEIYAIHKK